MSRCDMMATSIHTKEHAYGCLFRRISGKAHHNPLDDQEVQGVSPAGEVRVHRSPQAKDAFHTAEARYVDALPARGAPRGSRLGGDAPVSLRQVQRALR